MKCIGDVGSSCYIKIISAIYSVPWSHEVVLFLLYRWSKLGLSNCQLHLAIKDCSWDLNSGVSESKTCAILETTVLYCHLSIFYRNRMWLVILCLPLRIIHTYLFYAFRWSILGPHDTHDMSDLVCMYYKYVLIFFFVWIYNNFKRVFFKQGYPNEWV